MLAARDGDRGSRRALGWHLYPWKARAGSDPSLANCAAQRPGGIESAGPADRRRHGPCARDGRRRDRRPPKPHPPAGEADRTRPPGRGCAGGAPAPQPRRADRRASRRLAPPAASRRPLHSRRCRPSDRPTRPSPRRRAPGAAAPAEPRRRQPRPAALQATAPGRGPARGARRRRADGGPRRNGCAKAAKAKPAKTAKPSQARQGQTAAKPQKPRAPSAVADARTAVAPAAAPPPPRAHAAAGAERHGGAFGFVKRTLNTVGSTVNSVGSTIGDLGRSVTRLRP